MSPSSNCDWKLCPRSWGKSRIFRKFLLVGWEEALRKLRKASSHPTRRVMRNPITVTPTKLHLPAMRELAPRLLFSSETVAAPSS